MPIIYNIGTFLRAWAGEAAETRSQFHPRKKNYKNNPQTTEYLLLALYQRYDLCNFYCILFFKSRAK